MQPLSDHRHSKGFTGKFRLIMKDPNEGLDYASTLKYKKSTQKEEQEERQYLRNLIQSCKEAGERHDFIPGNQKETSLNIIKNVVSDQLGKRLINNPLIGALLNKKSKDKNKKLASSPQATFSRTQETFHKPQKKSDDSKAQTTYRVVVKNLKALQQKQFVKYPSSSLLHSNPFKYKEKVQISNGIVINSDSEDNDQERLQSFFRNVNKVSKPKSKKFLRVLSKEVTQSPKTRHISLPSEMNTTYCSLKNKYFKNKSFFNDAIIFLKKNTKELAKLQTVAMNDQVMEKITNEKLLEKSQTNYLPLKDYENSQTFDSFKDLISRYQRQNSQGKMERQNYESSFMLDKVQEDKTVSSKLYMKCWSNKKNDAPSYVQKVKAMNLTGILPVKQKNRLATEWTVFKKPQVPKYRAKSENRKVKTVL